MNLELGQRVIVITGASRGIGAATARVLADEGASLMLVSRDAVALEALRKTLPGKVEIIACDMNQPESAQQIVDQTLQHFGRIDGLVNCAGATSGGDPLTVAESAWRSSFELKFFSTLRLIQAVVPVMISSL